MNKVSATQSGVSATRGSRRARLALPLTAAILAGACAVGPDYREPAGRSTPSFVNAPRRGESGQRRHRGVLARLRRRRPDRADRARARRQRRRPDRPGTPAGVAGDLAGRARRAVPEHRRRRRRGPLAHARVPAARRVAQPAHRRASTTPASRPAGSSTSSAATAVRASRRRPSSMPPQAGVHAVQTADCRGSRAQLPRAARPAAAPRGGARLDRQPARVPATHARPARRRARHAARRRARADPARSTESTLPRCRTARRPHRVSHRHARGRAAARSSTRGSPIPRLLPIAAGHRSLGTCRSARPSSCCGAGPIWFSPSASSRRRRRTSASPPRISFRASTWSA